MHRKQLWLVAGFLFFGLAALGLSQGFAQFRSVVPAPVDSGPAPRYTVVSVTEGEVIIMDTTTGDLYSARPQDVKPFSTRRRPGATPGGFTTTETKKETRTTAPDWRRYPDGKATETKTTEPEPLPPIIDRKAEEKK